MRLCSRDLADGRLAELAEGRAAAIGWEAEMAPAAARCAGEVAGGEGGALSARSVLSAAVRSAFSSIPEVLTPPALSSSLSSRTLIVCGAGIEAAAAGGFEAGGAPHPPAEVV